MTPAARTPVLVGTGIATQRSDDPLEGTDAIGLMRQALDAAALDAGSGGTALLERVDEVIVPEGIWATRDPGRLVLGDRSPDARSVLAVVGVLQQSAFTRAARAIANGQAEVVVVCGGEAKWRSLRGQVTGVAAPPVFDVRDGEADLVLAPGGDVISDIEIHRGLSAPTHQYAVMESALRHHAHRSPADHARRIGALVAGMSRIAADNPDAWNRQPMSTDDVLAATLVAEPYTKPSCSQWNVDQAAAFILCAVEAAEALGVARDGWVFPVAGVESNLMVPVTERLDMHRSPAAHEVGAAIARALGRPVSEVELLEVYSCFPSAVQIQCAEFGIDVESGRDLTVTGGMHFAGGPLNSFTFQALARMVPLLRADPAATGVVTSVSGMLTKVGAGAWSATPPRAGFVTTDVTAMAAASTATRSVDPETEGTVTIVGYTVGHRGGEPVEAVIVADTAERARTVAHTTDAGLVDALRQGEWCGRTAAVSGADLLALED